MTSSEILENKKNGNILDILDIFF